MPDTPARDLPQPQRIERTLRVVQRCRRALLRFTDETELLREVCDAVVTDGGYKFAWVGVAEPEPGCLVRAVAGVGESDGYLDSIHVRWSDVPEGRGPTGTAVRTGHACWVRDMATDPLMAPWRDAAMARGFLSSIALPMHLDDRSFGALTIYARTVDAFDADEVHLLQELADDLAYGINAFRARIELLTMQQVVELSPTVVVVTDVNGDIEYVNPRFTQLTGYTLDEVRGKNPRLLKSGFTSDEEYQRLWATVTAGGCWSGEFRQRRKDGTTYAERATVVPVVDASKRIVKFMKLAEDLTALNALEHQFRHAQKMEAMGLLAGGIAHDFNNLLTAIRGFTEIALSGMPASDPRRDDLEQVLHAGESATTLTRQLLAFSRHRVLHTEFVDVAAVVAQSMPMVRRLLGEDITVSSDVADSRCIALTEPGHIEQILMNLVVNARDAMPTGGRFELTVAPTEVQAEGPASRTDLAPGTYVRLSATDSGVGMDGETRAHIFEPFFTTKAPGQGTGLGLSTVYGIVRQCNGAIDVVSERGRGTTFTIWLPLASRPEGTVADAVPGPTAAFSGRTILVVDDDPAVCEFACRTLRRAGYNVLESINPGEALLIAERHKGALDLLLTDVIMPRLTGVELYRRVAKMRPGVRTLYMSGYTDDVLKRADVVPGETEFIRKPFDGTTLLARVRTLLDS